MIYQTVNEWEFIRAFEDMGRKDQFSREGLRELFDYICDCSRDTGEDVELDVIALCCEWTEYPSWEDAEKECQMDAEELQDNTIVLEVSEGGAVLVLNF